MFFKQDEIDSALNCPICSDTFQDPRILPCGESACHKWIQTSTDHEFNCSFCHKTHKPADNHGFPPNLVIQKLLKAQPDQVYRNQKVENLNSKLAVLTSKSDELKQNLQSGTDQIVEYCIQLRNQVHLQTDVLVEKAHQLNENLISEIDDYELKCIESFEKKKRRFRKRSNRIAFKDSAILWLHKYLLDRV